MLWWCWFVEAELPLLHEPDELLLVPDDIELTEIMELGRRTDLVSGRAPINEFLNLGAVKQRGKYIHSFDLIFK